jgi:hypothetical protein
MFARHDLTSPLKQRSQNTQRLGLNFDRALPTEKSCGKGFELEIAETQPFVAANIHPEILHFSVASILISDEEGLSEDSCGWC